MISVLTLNMTAQEVKEFKPAGKVWGLVFGDYYYKIHSDSANRIGSQYSGLPKNANAFDFRRIYLGYSYDFTEQILTNIILSHEGQTLSDGTTRVIFLKSANVKLKNLLLNNDLIVGLQSTNAFALLTEKLWNYRSIEKMMTDIKGISKSSDVGISVQGRIDSTGNFGYNLMVGNGTGVKLENDKFKKFYGDVYAKLFHSKLILDFYVDYERVQLSPYHKDKYALKFLAAYQTAYLTMGVEAYRQMLHNFSIYTNTVSGRKDTTDALVLGMGVFMRGVVVKNKLNFFARVDWFNPDTKFNNDNVYIGYVPYNIEIFVTAGMDYISYKNIHLIPNIWCNIYKNQSVRAKGLERNDYDLVPRITLYYVFK